MLYEATVVYTGWRAETHLCCALDFSRSAADLTLDIVNPSTSTGPRDLLMPSQYDIFCGRKAAPFTSADSTLGDPGLLGMAVRKPTNDIESNNR
jgi:hypothetical protein